ncbi:ABC transporter ATP-binding protein [Geothermobacter hydrogeniphilus]|uniref:ABC transporter ATP-binding protein n=1 Tax=Geothermobacter hydrogeniphilus TaxID=1969733 RepID=A0A1X0Y2H1_9BACT|nr:ABC transporter ATP-binding protein [Geothermobacter hydrogeniphilus]ORJ59294.1 ABC transporter ATP-binding protein [Geothermobacter hydrogeniphilus]
MMRPAEVPILEAEELHTYYGASHILHGISLSIRAGETLSLMGRNGMGKTTLLRSLLGLTPPRRGTVKIHGRDMTGAPPQQIVRQGIAFVPEDRGIFPNLTVRENLIMAARPGPTGRRDWDLTRILDTFPRLAERMSNMGNHLSGGEQQMLTVGRALMTNPDLLLLDEATEGLAPLIRKEIWSVVRTIRQSGIAVVIVDKDIKALLKLADRNIILSKGRIVYEGDSADLAAKPEIHTRYLGV